MAEYVHDEAFEHRLARVLREIGDEAVVPFDPYETTQLIITNSRIGGVPITAIPAAQMAAQPAPPPLAPPMAPPLAPPNVPPPGYYDEPLPVEPSRWPLLAALGLLIAALVFAGFASGFIKLPSNFGITIGTPAPIQTTSPSPLPTLTSIPTSTATPQKTRKPRRTPRPRQTDGPLVSAEPQPTQVPTDAPTPEPPQPTPEPPQATSQPEPASTEDAAASPL